MKSGSCAGKWVSVQRTLVTASKKHILHDMLRLFRKWRLTRRLHKECAHNAGKQAYAAILAGGKVMVEKTAFTEQTASRIPWIKFWGKKYKTQKLNEISSLVDSCIAEGLFDAAPSQGGGTFIKTSSTGEDFYGHLDFIELCLSKYRSTATIVIIPLVTFVLGLFVPSILKKATEKPSVTAPAMKQECGGGNCAASVGQQGGITAGQLNINTDRHLTPKQIADIKAAKTVCSALPFVHVTASSDEAKRYAYEFIDALRGAGCRADLDLPIPGLRPDISGVWVGVRDINSPDPSANSLSRLLSNANVPTPLATMEPNFFPGDTFVLIVGAK